MTKVQEYRDGQMVREYDVPDNPQDTNESSIRTNAEQALDGLRSLANSSGTLTGAQLSNGLRLCARVLIALVRLALRRFDAAD